MPICKPHTFLDSRGPARDVTLVMAHVLWTNACAYAGQSLSLPLSEVPDP